MLAECALACELCDAVCQWHEFQELPKSLSLEVTRQTRHNHVLAFNVNSNTTEVQQVWEELSFIDSNHLTYRVQDNKQGGAVGNSSSDWAGSCKQQ